MQKREYLGAEGAAGIWPNLDRTGTAKLNWSTVQNASQNGRHRQKKRAVWIDGDGGVRSRALQYAGNVGIADQFHATGLREFPDIDFPLAVECESECSKTSSGIGILGAIPGAAGVFGIASSRALAAFVGRGLKSFGI